MQEGLLDIVCDLRGIHVTHAVKPMLAEEGLDDEEAHDLILDVRQRVLEEENRSIKCKIERLSRHIDDMRSRLEGDRDAHAGDLLGSNGVRDDNICVEYSQ